MKIFGLDIRRSLNASEKTPSVPAITPGGTSLEQANQKTLPSRPIANSFPKADLGDSGTRLLHGIITEEYNSQLQGIQGIKVFDEMRKSDGTVRAAVLVCTLPVRRAKWFVNPATEEQQDKDIANFVEHALFDWLDLSWDDVIRQALLSVSFGVMLFEKIYGIKQDDGKDWVTITKLAPRLPKSILKWELDDRTFGIQQIRQDGILAQIPGSKLLIFVNEREGDNWWGTSMLRAAYKHWYYKNSFYKIDAVAFERHGVGVPKIKMPQGYTENDEKKAATAAENLRSNESAYILTPPGYEAEFMDMGSTTLRDPQNSINHHDKAILQSVLAQFLELGQSSNNSGSRALSSDHSDLFLKAEEALANTIISVINKDLIPELVDLNFNNVKVYPKLDYSGITKIDISALGQAYAQLVTAGAITPTKEDQQYLRGAIGLPPRTQEDIDEESDGKPDEQDQIDHMDIEGGKKDKPEEDAEKIKKASKNVSQKNHEHKLLPRKFDDGTGFKSWRPLTFAEKKVSWQKIQDQMDSIESDFSKKAVKLLKEAKDDFMSKLHSAYESGDQKAIADLSIKLANDYKTLLKDTMKSAYETGKKSVSKEMNVEIPANTANTMATIDLQVDTIANKTASDLESKAKLAATGHLSADTDLFEALGAIESAINDAIQKSVDNTSSVIVGQSVNLGRNDVFERNLDDIYALQRSEILDSVTCNFCESMDGVIVDKDSSWAKQTIFHSNCRGIWVEILKNEENPPDITGVSDELSNYYGGEVNSLVQPTKVLKSK